jgi:hypothetical protein
VHLAETTTLDLLGTARSAARLDDSAVPPTDTMVNDFLGATLSAAQLGGVEDGAVLFAETTILGLLGAARRSAAQLDGGTVCLTDITTLDLLGAARSAAQLLGAVAAVPLTETTNPHFVGLVRCSARTLVALGLQLGQLLQRAVRVRCTRSNADRRLQPKGPGPGTSKIQR